MQKYITDTFVLNPPKFNFTNLDDFKNEVIYIKRDEKDYIPCLFIQDINRCNKFLIFFHGNNEHIFDLEMEAGIMREELKMNVIVVEYPGYSIYISQKSPKKILEDSIIVYDYIKEKFNLKDEDIFLYGRSIGSSPSIYLATKRKANALFVISGFSSLKNVGRGLLVGWAIEDIFKNIEYIPKVHIPIYLIHGKIDSLISYEQTLELYNNSTSKIKDFKIIEKMSHNNYNLIEDILNNIRSFLYKNINIIRVNDYYNLYNKKYDDMFIMPEYILKFLDNLNFNFEAYSKLNKNFQNQVQFILLLENERIAIISNYEISICDTLNFNKFCSLKDNNKIIFANKLKNGNILYCNDNSICKIVKIEFSQFFSYDIKEEFKIDNFGLNYCKIIEIDNEKFISLMESFYPLQIISKNKTSEYQCQKIKIFENKVLNDIIYLEDNRIAAVFKNRNILIIYNYIDNKKQEVTFPCKNNYYIKPKLFFFENEYIFILFNNFIIVYDLLLTKIIKTQTFIFKTRYIANNFIVNNSFQEIFPSYIYYINAKCLIIGTDDGKALLYNFEKSLYENINNQEIFSDDNSLTLDKSDKTKIKNILLLSNKTMCILTEQNLFIFFKNKSVNKSQSCSII